MKKLIIRIDNRESTILTVELTHVGYQVEKRVLRRRRFRREDHNIEAGAKGIRSKKIELYRSTKKRKLAYLGL